MYYSIDYLKGLENPPREYRPGYRKAWFDRVMRTWRLKVQLDLERIWFLTIFIDERGEVLKYYLDRELASDSHFEFADEGIIRNVIYEPGDEALDFPEVLIRYVDRHGGSALLGAIRGYICHEYHYD